MARRKPFPPVRMPEVKLPKGSAVEPKAGRIKFPNPDPERGRGRITGLPRPSKRQTLLKRMKQK